jgi:hypothetical protein
MMAPCCVKVITVAVCVKGLRGFLRLPCACAHTHIKIDTVLLVFLYK